jgi:hypothetical protein
MRPEDDVTAAHDIVEVEQMWPQDYVAVTHGTVEVESALL